MRTLLIRCYPATWRVRYEDEFLAILEERPLGPFDVADVLVGALDARLRSRGRGAVLHERNLSMSLRIGGIAAVAGGALWAVAGLLGFVLKVNPLGPALLFLAGWLAFLVAIIWFTAFEARRSRVLAWVAVVIPALGACIGIAGIVGMLSGSFGIGFSYWSLFNLTAVPAVGFTVFALVAYGIAPPFRLGAVTLFVGAIAPFIFFGAAMEMAAGIGLALIVTGWFVLGIQALRLDQPSSAPRPA